MSFGREEEEPHHRGRGLDGHRSSRRKPPLRLLLLLILLVALLALLAIGALLASRSFGNDVSGKVLAEDSADSGPNPELRISNKRGTVRVEGVESLESIEFEATKYTLGSDREEARQRASEVSTDLSRNGSTFVIETVGGRATGADYTLRAPQGSSIELESEAGDVEIANLDGDVSVRTGAGDVQVKATKGSVEVRALQGDVEVSSVSTDAGQVDVDVGVGDAVMRDLVVGVLDLRIETGEAVLSGRFSGSGNVLVQTGDVLVRVPTEDVREMTFETRIGDVLREPDEPGEE